MSRADQIRQAASKADIQIEHGMPVMPSVAHVLIAVAREYADWLDGPTDEEIRAMAWEWLAIEYSNETIDDDPDWAAEAVSRGGFAFEACERLLEAVRVRREQR